MDVVVVICGPTATGKTKLALQLAKEFDGELVNADSRQIYIGNDVETGKDKDLIEQSGIKIWLYDLVKPNEKFSVSQWRKLAYQAIDDILSRDKLPIVVGGSGLYIKALVQNLPDVDIPRDNALRKELEGKSVTELTKYLDPKRLQSMNESDIQNSRRLIRAIELQKESPFSLERRLLNKFEFVQIGLTAPKETLIERIKRRIAARGLGQDFEKKEINIMKKQLVWFKKQPGIQWYNID